MYISVGTSKTHPGQTAEATRIWWDEALPVYKAAPGLKNIYWLTNESADEIVVIGMWETEAAAQSAENTTLFKDAVAKLAQLLSAPPTRKIYQLGAQA